MLAHTKKRPTKQRQKAYLTMSHQGVSYRIPAKVAEKYKVIGRDDEVVDAEDVFADINAKYTKPGALLKGLRARENLTQVALAQKLKVTQSDISQMECGKRVIGRSIAQRIEKLFAIDYRSFLS